MNSRLIIVGSAAIAAVMANASVTSKVVGKIGGKSIKMFSLKNARGMSTNIMTWGATVVTLSTPDKAGAFDDVVCGFDKITDYPTKSPYFGTIVGRYGNRIAGGKFKLNGKTYKLAVNNGPNSLHGGLKGFDKRVWSSQVLKSGAEPSVMFTYVSKSGEEGYPGALTARVTYTLTADNALKIDYAISTTKATVANLTNHSYFNLAGKKGKNALDHVVMIDADAFTPVNKTLIPTGELKSVEGTPFDFRTATPIGERIDADDEQIKFGGGYDHNWVLNGKAGTLRKAVVVDEPLSGRNMEVWTTEPGVQFYTGNFLDGTLKGKGGKVYPKRYAFCFETQHFPDSPNQAKFPTTVVKPGQTYRSTTIYKFSAKQ